MPEDGDTIGVKHPPAYVAPLRRLDAYHCAFCGVYAHQYHFLKCVLAQNEAGQGIFIDKDQQFGAHQCGRCQRTALWRGETLIYPVGTTAPLAVADTPSDVAEDFNEARTVLPYSARSAGALLRLALQKLMPHLGQKGKDLNDGIAALVKQGLPVLVQQSLDALRVIGNNAVHPGVLDLRDNSETALSLFHVLNLIVEEQITKPNTVRALYDSLPQGARDAIEKRDAKAKP